MLLENVMFVNKLCQKIQISNKNTFAEVLKIRCEVQRN